VGGRSAASNFDTREARYARALLNAFVEETRNRGVRRIWVASYDSQAPGMYEKAGFERMAEFEGWPEGHTNVGVPTPIGGLSY
jgi:ribosomal protein S18 acetylase RimI-like enzyme